MGLRASSWSVFGLAWALLILCINGLHAQINHSWQNRASYRIEVALDDEQHFLRGSERIFYTNHSPDTLSSIYIHLYTNAYKNSGTAFAQQLAQQGHPEAAFAPYKDRGFIDSLQFAAIDQKQAVPLRLQLQYPNIDIAELFLHTPLLPGDSIILQTSFRVKIPTLSSRLGHAEQNYAITQWFPKIAVYDARKGWNKMPYLDQGEYYSDFGQYDVTINLPSNYVVAATGELQTASEIEFVKTKTQQADTINFTTRGLENNNIPESSKTRKSIRFLAENVHDFAWFADKRYYIKMDSVTLSDGRTIPVFAYFTNAQANLWHYAPQYMQRAIRFYSDQLGNYPYKYASAVQSDFAMAGGMEYPMITNLGAVSSAEDLDLLITHELGHNWFYGILANNERSEPYLDEGLNTFLEYKYAKIHYGNNPSMLYYSYLAQARRGKDQPISTSSENFTATNYYAIIYSKSALGFRYLEDYLGEEKMGKIMRNYYRQFAFKHISPDEVRAFFQSETGDSLSWFFDDFIQTNKRIDYTIRRAELDENNVLNIQIRNLGEIPAPISLAILDDTSGILKTMYLDGFAPKSDTILRIKGCANFDRCILNHENTIPEYRRANNVYKNRALLPRTIFPKPRLLANFSNPDMPSVNLLPAIGFNQYDGFQIGAAIYNNPLPMRRFQYALAPIFGTKSKSLCGMGEIQYNYFPLERDRVQNISIGLNAKRFNYQRIERFGMNLAYLRLNLYAEIRLANANPTAQIEKTIRFENIFLNEQSAAFSNTYSAPGASAIYTDKVRGWRSAHRLAYLWEDRHVLHPMRFKLQAEYANYRAINGLQSYLKLTAEANFKFMYGAHQGLDLRVFGGVFPYHTDRRFGAFPLQLTNRNYNDYFYDDLVTARSEQDNFGAQQISIRDGGFKTVMLNSVFDGSSNAFLLSANLKADLPIKLPFGSKYVKLKPYFDFGYFKNTQPSVTIISPSETIWYSGGLMLDINNGMAGLCLPLFANRELWNQVRSRGNVGARMTFFVRFDQIRPFDWAKRIEM